jgi:hypothetical protein
VRRGPLGRHGWHPEILDDVQALARAAVEAEHKSGGRPVVRRLDALRSAAVTARLHAVRENGGTYCLDGLVCAGAKGAYLRILGSQATAGHVGLKLSFFHA